MQTLGTIREFKTPNFRVIVDAVEDPDADLSFDDTGEVIRQLETGELICFAARARVFLNGAEVASDYLGSCIYKSLQDFADHRECGKQNREYAQQGKSGRCGSYFAGMVKTVCAEARTEIKLLQSIKVRA